MERSRAKIATMGRHLTVDEIETATDLPLTTVRDTALGRTSRSNQ